MRCEYIGMENVWLLGTGLVKGDGKEVGAVSKAVCNVPLQVTAVKSDTTPMTAIRNSARDIQERNGNRDYPWRFEIFLNRIHCCTISYSVNLKYTLAAEGYPVSLQSNREGDSMP